MTDTIGSSIRSGVGWKAASQVTLQVSRVVVALVLARVLAPHDWGLAAMVLVFSGFVVVFTDSALGTALVQRRTIVEEDRSTVFWLSAAIGLVLMLGGFAAARPLAAFYGEPQVAGLFAALSVGFFVSALATTPTALLAREMQFRQLELRQIVAALAGSVCGITVALLGYGAWAIVAQQLAEVATSSLVLWYATPWRPSLVFSVASVRRLGGFAGNVFGENLLYQGGRNLGGLLIGRFLGAASVGVYVLGTNVILVPFSRLAAPLQQVFFPAFSRMSDDRARIADVWIRASRLVGVVSIPSLVGLVVVAPDFVHVALGSRWSDAVPVIQILAWVGIVQSLQTLNGEVLLALGRAATLTRLTLVWFVGNVVAFVAGVHWGILGVAAAYTAVTFAVEPLRALLTTRALGIPLSRFLHAFDGVVQATIAMAVVVLATRALLLNAGVTAGVRLALLVPIGAVAYLGACLWRAPEVTEEVRRIVGARRSAAAARAEQPAGQPS